MRTVDVSEEEALVYAVISAAEKSRKAV
jgi:hypothetical protein